MLYNVLMKLLCKCRIADKIINNNLKLHQEGVSLPPHTTSSTSTLVGAGEELLGDDNHRSPFRALVLAVPLVMSLG